MRAVDMPGPQMPRRVFLEVLRLLDEVDLALRFRRRAVVMKSVPNSCSGCSAGQLKQRGKK